jgi:alkylated DNA repair dioxygenase AlkB
LARAVQRQGRELRSASRLGRPAGAVRRIRAGVGIGWHRESRARLRTVGRLGLQIPFRRKAGGWERFTLEAQPRSLYMMGGDSRHVWEHSIPAVDALRYS